MCDTPRIMDQYPLSSSPSNLWHWTSTTGMSTLEDEDEETHHQNDSPGCQRHPLYISFWDRNDLLTQWNNHPQRPFLPNLANANKTRGTKNSVSELLDSFVRLYIGKKGWVILNLWETEFHPKFDKNGQKNLYPDPHRKLMTHVSNAWYMPLRNSWTPEARENMLQRHIQRFS